jgi:tetratricopeptide (TPR) repeat protein
MPVSVRDLLHQRLRAESETARQLVTAAAVIGRSFDFATLRAVSGRSELEIVDGLEELIGRGIIVERALSDPAARSAYDFTHEKLRSLAYEEASLARRRLLHLRTAEALAAAAVLRKDDGGQAGLAAAHFQAAGQMGRAAEYFRLAAENARSLHANKEALAHYQAALAAGSENPAHLHEAIGDLQTLSGDYAEAIASYQAASAFCQAECFGGLMRKIGGVFQRRGEWAQAEAHFQAALEADASTDPLWLAGLYADWSLTAHLSAQPAQALGLAELALQQAQVSGEAGALAQALNLLGILSRARGDLEQAVTFLESSLEAAGRTDDPAVQAAALNNLGRAYQECGQVEQAIQLTHQALELCIRLGDRHRQAALHNNLADLYHAAGQEAESQAELKQAVVLFAVIGGNPELPQIWKLSEW